MLSTILIIILAIAVIGSLPRYSYSSAWGYGPSGILGFVLLLVLILALAGRL